MAPAGATSPDSATANWQALGSTVVVRVCDPGALQDACTAVDGELSRIDRACSRFRGDSDLSRVNAHAGEDVAVDSLLIEALEVALSAAQLTGGDVDPTLGHALELTGYDRDWQRLRDACAEPGARRPGSVVAALVPAWPKVRIDRSRRTVRVPAGAGLDLGATAKAWAADRAAAAASAAGGCGALVGIGGDIATHGRAPVDGWLVHVTDDHRSDASAPGQTVRIRNGGVATSTTTVRRWQRAGRPMHHIIDPRTLAPARGAWRTVSVAAADCTQANIAATAAIVRGGDAARWLARLALPARLVTYDGGVQSVGGWPRQEPAARSGQACIPAQRASGSVA